MNDTLLSASPRFGKWINVHFDRQGTIAGAEIKTYLLEKARVIHQTDGERNYHIFYQVCGAASQHKMLSDLGLGNPSQFNYTKTCTTANNMDDGKSFERTKQALHFIGFDPQTQQHIFAALSAVLHLGSLAFTADKNGDAIMADDRNLSVMSSLLKVDPQEVRKAVCNRVISAGGETMVKPETLEKAYQCRDALAKALYSKLFDHIVTCVNAALKLKSNMQTMQVSVLDIFGFEVFQFNRFEQFCINYANEKLQLHFNHYNFMLERQLYAKEGIELIESDFVDNSAYAHLPPISPLSLLHPSIHPSIHHSTLLILFNLLPRPPTTPSRPNALYPKTSIGRRTMLRPYLEQARNPKL